MALTLRNSSVERNKATSGGGLLVNGGEVTLVDSMINGNEASLFGGGFSVTDGGKATLTSSVIGGNKAQDGGGLYSAGQVTLRNSTVTTNQARANGGGIAVPGGTLELQFVTLTQNIADSDNDGNGAVGGILRGIAASTVLSSIVAGNTRGAGVDDDCFGGLTSQGYNLWGNKLFCPATGPGDQDLTTLRMNIRAVLNEIAANNGGPTPTHALVAGSPAIDKGAGTGCPSPIATDQRGVARPRGAACDVGAYEYTPPPTETVGLDLTVPVALGEVRFSPAANVGDFGFTAGTVVTLTAQPAPGNLFTGWIVDGRAAGWANPLTITLDTGRAVEATFAPRQTFGDAGPDKTGATEAIAQLAAREIIKGCDQEARPPLFCPTDPTLRAQMAVLIVRALGWGGENPTNPFTDRDGVDDELWQAVAILADHGVANGYGGGLYGTTDPVLNAQVISFITRAMVDAGHWTFQTDDGSVYPNVSPDSGHRADLATYARYAGPVRGTASATDDFAGWDQPSSRAYFAFALWQALDSHFSVDRVP